MIATLEPVEFAPTVAPSRSLAESILAPLHQRAEESSNLVVSQQAVTVHGQSHDLPKFLFLGPRGGGHPIRLAIFAGLEARKIQTVLATSHFLHYLDSHAGLAKDYALFAYPVVNLGGFGPNATPRSDFELRFANSTADEDVQFFKTELRKWFFNGLITLRVDAQATGLSATVRSDVIAQQVAGPALLDVKDQSLVDGHPVRVRPSDRYARLADYAFGRIAPPAEVRPYPFEVEFTIPGNNAEAYTNALVEAQVGLLRHYRSLITHAADL